MYALLGKIESEFKINARNNIGLSIYISTNIVKFVRIEQHIRVAFNELFKQLKYQIDSFCYKCQYLVKVELLYLLLVMRVNKSIYLSA